MLENREAILEVARLSDVTDDGTSSHWRAENQIVGDHPLKQDPFNFTYGAEGFGSIGPIGAISTKTGFMHRAAHATLQIPIRRIGRHFKTFADIDRAAANIAKTQGRVYDKDLLRHALTLALLRDQLDMESETDPIVIIGDGFANMASLVLATLPQSRVILVNLTKTLLVDLAFSYRAFPDAGIAFVKNAAEMDEAMSRHDIRVIGLSADSAALLAGAPVALGINILSMMEMDPPVIKKYFEVLRQCPRAATAFYCCNRIEKQLPDGTVTRFFEYPWDSKDKIIIDEPSPWDKYGYRKRPPFYYRNHPVQHRLVSLKKQA